MGEQVAEQRAKSALWRLQRGPVHEGAPPLHSRIERVSLLREPFSRGDLQRFDEETARIGG